MSPEDWQLLVQDHFAGHMPCLSPINCVKALKNSKVFRKAQKNKLEMHSTEQTSASTIQISQCPSARSADLIEEKFC